MSARKSTENDLFGDRAEHRAYGPQFIKWGTVGWDGDASDADVIEVGDGSDGPLGRSLVKVTLFSGRDITKRPVAGVAQGRQIKAQLPWGLTIPPPLGMQVMVAFPDGDMDSPGNGGIFFMAAPAAKQQFKAGKAILDVGATMSLTVMGLFVKLMDHLGDDPGTFGSWLGVGALGPNGEPMIYGTDGAGGTVSVGLNAAGMTCGDGSTGVSAALSLGGPSATVPGVGLCYNGQGFITLDNTGAWDISGQSFGIGTGTISLGVMATPATPVLLGVTGMAGVGSLTIFGQP